MDIVILDMNFYSLSFLLIHKKFLPIFPETCNYGLLFSILM